jgi:hypothetical protein
MITQDYKKVRILNRDSIMRHYNILRVEYEDGQKIMEDEIFSNKSKCITEAVFREIYINLIKSPNFKLKTFNIQSENWFAEYEPVINQEIFKIDTNNSGTI